MAPSIARQHQLPERQNTSLEEERAPSHEILVERRCLGQTELKVKPGQVGTSNATKLENLGVLDYAHLRVPLPKDLTGSGIFLRGTNRKWPEAYFLMRRSSDGFISATGMFKAAFPWAQADEETAEKEYIKSLEEASSEEVAGNVWIDPKKALDLAEEYGIKLWIAALLDPEPITHGTSDPKKSIKSPPPFHMSESANGASRESEKTPGAGRRTTRGVRSLRSESPSKAKATPRKIATPRRPRRTRGTTAEPEESATEVNGSGPKDTVRIEVETTTRAGADGELEDTKLKVEMPSGHPDLVIPEDPTEMIKKANEMVAEANRLEGVRTQRESNKRKIEDVVGDDDEVEAEAAARAASRAKPVEVELRKEKIRRRALTGIAATLAVGALIPSIIAAFPW
ncbi:putative bouquet formation protein [Septoria linicola]|nr:putative bouquet formation protein [Septoria linicola]